MSTPLELYRADQVRQLDRLAATALVLDGYGLMQRAGAALLGCLRRHWPQARSLLIVAGTGNNGGDGYVLGRLALQSGLNVRLMQTAEAPDMRGAAAQARCAFLDAGGFEERFDGETLPEADLLVDAVFGTGLSRALEGRALQAVQAINRHMAPKLAVDVPSGLHSDTGVSLDTAVRADVTLSFIARKQGLYTGFAADHRGVLEFDALGAPEAVYRNLPAQAWLIDPGLPQAHLRPRPRTAHKGQFGHLLVVGGDAGMLGAVHLAGEAALRTGAGRVTVATHASNAALLAVGCASLMSRGVERPADLDPLLEQVDQVAIGPGLGTGSWGSALLARILETRLPLVLDADALNLLARDPVRRGNWVLTPHPAEAGRLLGLSTAQVQADRFHAARTLQERYGGVSVLKGAGTLVQSAQRCAVCPAGNPGMATAGMGDVLTGIIAGLLAQGLDAVVAAELGVLLHAQSADRAARQGGERGMLASDLFSDLRGLVNPGG